MNSKLFKLTYARKSNNALKDEFEFYLHLNNFPCFLREDFGN